VAKLVKARVAIPYHGSAFVEFEGIMRREVPDQKIVELKPMEAYVYG